MYNDQATTVSATTYAERMKKSTHPIQATTEMVAPIPTAPWKDFVPAKKLNRALKKLTMNDTVPTCLYVFIRLQRFMFSVIL
jgi:hypothetical protein